MSGTALVLSGGGMFGAYQAGVWKALSGRLTPRIVVGASVGALNGWLIASGVTAEDLVEMWLDPAASTLMTYASPRSPLGGVFDPRPLRDRAQHLVERYTPRVEYGVVVLQLPWLRPELVRNAEVSWRHLVASCSVPLGFPPVRIGRGLYCDGGLLEPTPVWAAAAMGATRVIAVNSSRFIPPTAVKLMAAGLYLVARKGSRAGNSLREDLNVTLVTPKDFLGRMRDGAAWRKDNIRRWIDLGEADAHAALSELHTQTASLA
jgi:NTE family protein